ncbi:MAG: beta strand repeat-containing protein, partial [Shimia sp.]
NEDDGTATIGSGTTLDVAQVDNAAVGSITAFGEITGAVSNSGTFVFAGGSAAAFSNTTTGIVDVDAGGTVSGTTTNTGLVNLNGGTLVAGGGVVNDAGGVLEIGTSAAPAAPAILDGDVANDVGAATSVAANGDITGLVTNSGDLTLDGGSIGALANSGIVDVDSGGAILGSATSAATMNVNGGSLTLGSSPLVNLSSGSLTVDAGAAIVGSVSNSGVFTVDGTTGDVTNAGTLTVATGGGAGAIANTGSATIDGSAGDIVNDGSLVVNAGAFVGAVDNSTTGQPTTLGINPLVTTPNFTFAGTAASITNAGVLSARSGARTTGAFTQSAGGVLDLTSDGTPDTVLTFGGDARLDGVVNLDADLSSGSDTGDVIEVGGTLSGDFVLNVFERSGAPGDSDEITVFNFGTTGAADFADLSVDLFVIDPDAEVGDIDGDGLDDTYYPVIADSRSLILVGATSGSGENLLVLDSSIGAAGALAASIGLTQTAVGTIINRPTSPFVVDLAMNDGTPECAPGGWARLTGGAADISGSFTDESSSTRETADVSLDYGGLQIGGDLACFGGGHNGFDLAIGGTLAYNTGSSFSENLELDPITREATDTVLSFTDTDFDQTYAGVYMTAARDRLFGDIQLRFEQIGFESTNTELVANRGLALQDNRYSNTAATLSGSIGYSWPIESVEGLTLVSAAGFSYTRNDTDTIVLQADRNGDGVIGAGEDDGTIALDNGVQAVGFVSGTVARSRVLPDDVSLLSYFGTVTLYNDFAGTRNGTYTDEDGDQTPFSIDNLGTYGEVSAGVNYLRLLSPGDAGNPRQLNASARIDARVGESVESWGIAAQLRLQF